MENGKVTIFDVARLAGVSKGTVDRVLHNRGEVSAKSAEKVRQAIEELRYEPNLYASLLASKKEHMIACLMPAFQAGEYWSRIHEGFLAGAEEARTLGVTCKVWTYDQYDADSFHEAARQVLAASPSGVVMPPLFADQTRDFTAALTDADIPYVFVDTRYGDEGYLAYFGMPMYDSGKLCANLLTDREKDVDRIALVRLKRQTDPTAARRRGFLDYVRTTFPNCETVSVFIDPEKSETIDATLKNFFAENPDIRFMALFNSRAYLLDGFMKSGQAAERRLVAFDNLDRNIEMLRTVPGMLLIAQHTEEQSRMAVKALTDYILFHKLPAKRDNFMHMDILGPYNIDNY